MASIAILALMAAPACASAASPVLEFASPGNSFPIPFKADGGAVTAAMDEFESVVHCGGSHGEGALTGPRSALSQYDFTECVAQGGSHNDQPCATEGASSEEIRSDEIEAELVFIDQAKHDVGMLLNPHGGTYMEFECGGESVKAIGPFLSRVGPIDLMTSSFAATLTSADATQIPNEYEGTNGEGLPAIPMGEREGHPAATTGVTLEFTILPAVPLEIRVRTAAEVEAKQHEEEATAAAAKKHEEEEAAALAAKKHQEEAEAKARKRHLNKALKQCKKIKPGQKRARCVKRAKKKYGSHRGNKKPDSAYRLHLTAARRS